MTSILKIYLLGRLSRLSEETSNNGRASLNREISVVNKFETPEKVREAFYNLSTSPPANEQAFLSRLLREISAPDNFSELVQAILKSPKELPKIAEQSYSHRNGFKKLVIASAADYKLRLHIYNPVHSYQENIHNHRWPFASTVLVGSLSQQFFEVDTSSTNRLGVLPVKEYIYSPNGAAGSYHTDYVKNSYLKSTAKTTTYEGEFYYLDSKRLHRVCKGDKGGVTLMVTSKPSKRECSLYAEHDFFSKTHLSHLEEPLKVDKVEELLKTVSKLKKPKVRG